MHNVERRGVAVPFLLKFGTSMKLMAMARDRSLSKN
jgi:hypothetical protein